MRKNTIKEDISLYALEIGRMLNLGRSITEAEAAGLYERWICDGSGNAYGLRFGDFLAFVCIKLHRDDPIFHR
jgi:hypothetical protein